MFAIYEKTSDEMSIEQAKHPNKLICPYSIPIYHNNQVRYIDTYDLTEPHILWLIQEDLVEFITPGGPYTITGLKAPIIFRLLTLLRPDFSPSANMVLQLSYAQMIFGKVITRMMKLLKCDDMLSKANSIAQKKKEDLKDTTPISQQDIIDALQEMVAEEQLKNSQQSNDQAKKVN